VKVDSSGSTVSAILAAARLPDGSLQCSAMGLRSPTHLRALLEQDAADREDRGRELERRAVRAEAAAERAMNRSEVLERECANLALKLRGHA
jgi:hypothetical protein